MKLSYDASVDALHIKLSQGIRQVQTKHVDEDIALDFDEENRLVGIEVLDASKRLDLGALLPVTVKG